MLCSYSLFWWSLATQSQEQEQLNDIRVQVQGVLCMRAVLEVSLGLFDDIVLQVSAEWLIVGERECESACATGQCAEYR